MSVLGQVILKGLYASLPAAGMQGRLYFATDTQALYRDNGTTWDLMISTAGVSGPSSSVSGDFAQFNGTSGVVLEDGGISLDTDGTLAADSDSRISSQKAVKTYVTATVAGSGPTFVDDEIVAGSGTAWTIAVTPAATPLLFVELPGFGLVGLKKVSSLTGSGQYTLSGTTLTTYDSHTTGQLHAWYRH